MAVADAAPASTTPPEWDAPDFTPGAGAGAPAAPVQGALAPKREEAKKKEEPKKEEPKPEASVGQRPVDQPATNPPDWDAPDFAAEEQADPTTTTAAPSGLDKAKGLISAWVKGSVNHGLTSLHSGALLTGAAAKALDTIHDAFNTYGIHKEGDAGGHTEAQDAWFSHTVDPLAAKQAETQLGPDATTAEKATYGTAQTLNMIMDAVAMGGRNAPESMMSWGGRAVYGAQAMTAPAATQAIEVGNRVLAATGDKKAALAAASASYTTTAAMGVVPGALGVRAATKLATGGAIGYGSYEAQRLAQNAAMPADMTPEERREADLTGAPKHEDLQEPDDPLNATLAAATGVGFGVHATIAGGHAPVREERTTAMEHAEAAAAEASKAAGGDNLEQVVAATHASAEVGSIHDAAAVHQLRIEGKRAEVQQEAEQQAAAAAEQQKESDFSAAERQKAEAAGAKPAPRADEGFAAREAEQAKAETRQKEKDYPAARNQVADEAIANAEGVKKGGAEEAPPTIAEALPPEQVGALQALRDRLAAARENPQEAQAPVEAPKEVPTLADRRLAAAKAEQETEAGHEKVAAAEAKPGGLPPLEEPQTLGDRRAAAAAAEQETPFVPRTKAEIRAEGRATKEAATAKAETDFEPLTEEPAKEAPKAAEKPAALPEEEEAPEANPAPVTAQTLKERRQQALDKAMAEKVRGTREAAKTPQEGANTEPPAEGAPKAEPESPPPNRLAAIKAAAEKARVAREANTEASASKPEEKGALTGRRAKQQLKEPAPVPEREGPKQFVARDPETGKELGRADDFDGAKALKEKHPDADITHEDAGVRARGALQDKREENHRRWFGKSTITNDDGTPRVMYHGTTRPGGFNVFDRNAGTYKTHGESMNAIGSYFSTDPEHGNTFAGAYEGKKNPATENGHVMPVHLKVENPLHIESQKHLLDLWKEHAGGNDRGTGGDPNKFRAWLKSEGHDGLVMRAKDVDPGLGGKPDSHYVVTLDPEQVKSAVGNSGEFNPKNPDIRAQAAPDAFAQDIANAMRPSKEEAMPVVARTLRGVKADVARTVMVHDGDETLPQSLKEEPTYLTAKGPNGTPPRGVFDPKTGMIHVIAKGHTDLDDVQNTLVHELAHKGVRNFLGEDYETVLDDVARNASADGRRWMQDYANQHRLDLSQKSHRAHVADEFGAHMAEHPEAYDRSTWGRIVDAVRAGLRKMGIVREWTDADVRHLLRRSDNGLRNFRPDVAAREADMSPRFAANRSDTDPTLPHGDPEMVAAKIGRILKEQEDAGPATLRSRADWLRSVGESVKGGKEKLNVATMSARLRFLHLDSLPDIVHAMGSAKEFVRMVGTMNGRKGRLMDIGATNALKWSRWANGGIFRDPNTREMTIKKGQADGGQALNTVMHGSTLAGVHPDKPYEARFTGELTPQQEAAEAARKQAHKTLSDMYNKLDPEGKEIYQKVKQDYQDRRADVLHALEARIAETGASEDTKKRAMADLRKAFEGGRVQGPYFPLARFGDHWARAIHPDTQEHLFSRFEDILDRKKWLAERKAEGFNVEQGTKLTNQSMMERIDPDFVKNVMSATEGHSELQDEIWQHYLKGMPEMSMRKNMIHRKGVSGFNQDALRAYAFNSFHASHQIARLEYGNRLDSVMNNIEKEAAHITNTQQGTNNEYWAPALAKEFRERLNWIRNPKASAGAAKLTQLGFAYYIAGSPATAIRISTQNAMLAEPYLGARASALGVGYGAGRAELWRAVTQWTKANIGSGGKSTLRDVLRGNEQAGYDEARAQGTFSSTSSQMLASGGADRPIGVGWADAITRVGSFLFNAAEHKNRETTFLAAYRIATRAGMSHEEATREGIDASNKAHFNYNNYNRPRVLQNDFMKVAGLFKQYPWQVTDRLARSFRDGVMRNPELTVGQRNEQLKAFAGYMGKMMLFAGIKGVPILYHATMAAINAAFGDEDKPFDAQAALREHLEHQLGTTASDAIMDGPMSAITGAALTTGASYSDLWYKQPQRDMNDRDQAMDLLAQLAGPVYGKIPDVGTGMDIMRQGDVERGLEHFAPAAVTHIMKGTRMANEGVTNLRGEQVVSPEELGQGWSTSTVGLGAVRNKNLLLQYLGFSPEVVARQYEKNNAEHNFSDAIHKQQAFLTQQYDNAVGRGDNDAALKWMEKMQKFHRANPGLAWSAKGMINSIRMHQKNTATADHGVNMAPGVKAEYDQMTGAQE